MDQQKNSDDAGASKSQRVPLIRDPKSLAGATGYLLLGSTVLLLFNTALESRNIHPDPQGTEPSITWFLRNFGQDVYTLLAACLLAGVGFKLLGIAGKTATRVIPDEDRTLLEPLVSKADADAINQYVKLSSLTGFTGTFQKIGFTGLPLATVTITLIFAALSFLNLQFLELAKLTLGAFIGSFVQKSTDAAKLSEFARTPLLDKIARGRSQMRSHKIKVVKTTRPTKRDEPSA